MLMWYSGRSLFQCKQMQKLQRKKFIWRNVFYPIFARISLAFSHSIFNAKLQRITLLPSSSTAHGEMKRERERRERKSANKKSDCKITNACMSNGNGDYCYDTRARRESTVHSRTRHTGFEQLQTKWWDDNNNENYSTFVSCKQTHTHSRIRVAFENILFSVWLRHFCTFAVCACIIIRAHIRLLFLCVVFRRHRLPSHPSPYRLAHSQRRKLETMWELKSRLQKKGERWTEYVRSAMDGRETHLFHF